MEKLRIKTRKDFKRLGKDFEESLVVDLIHKYYRYDKNYISFILFVMVKKIPNKAILALIEYDIDNIDLFSKKQLRKFYKIYKDSLSSDVSIRILKKIHKNKKEIKLLELL